MPKHWMPTFMVLLATMLQSAERQATAATSDTKSFGIWKVTTEQSAFGAARTSITSLQKEVSLEVNCRGSGAYGMTAGTQQSIVAASPNFEIAKVKYKIGAQGKIVEDAWSYIRLGPGFVSKKDAGQILEMMATAKGNFDLLIGLGDYTFNLNGFKDAFALLRRSCN